MGNQENNLDQSITGHLLSMRQVADRLNISIRSVWRLIARGELSKPVKMGKQILRFIPSEIEAYIERLKQNRGAIKT